MVQLVGFALDLVYSVEINSHELSLLFHQIKVSMFLWS